VADIGTTRRKGERDVAGPAMIVVPSLLSGAGLVLILVAIFLDNELAQKILLAIGVVALWLDFFTTMAIFRYSIRSINRRLRVIESSVERGEERDR
jgi:hypothetical protein